MPYIIEPKSIKKALSNVKLQFKEVEHYIEKGDNESAKIKAACMFDDLKVLIEKLK